MNNTQVKFKTTVSSNLTANDLLGKDCEGAFIYSSTAKKLYLFDGSQVIPIGKNIFQIDENNPNQNYEDNAFYTNNLGELYFIFDGIKHEIARASDISANNQSIQGQIDTLDSAITSTNTTINALSEKVGNPGAIGDDIKKSTGIYEILDEKVNNTVFEEYKTAQASAFATYKTEAENKFLSADEDLFLVDGYLKYGKLENDTWTDDAAAGKPYIILVLKNNNDSGTDNNTIYIPVEDLVDVYTVTDTDTVDMTLTGLDIKADVKTENLISSTDTDTVTLSVEKNKIKTGFNTSNIIKKTEDTDSVALSIDNNQIVANVQSGNIIDDDTLKLDGNKKIQVNLSALIPTDQTNAAVVFSVKENTLQATLSDANNSVLANAANALQLINNNATAIADNKKEFKDYVSEHAKEFSQYAEDIGTYAYTEKTDNAAATSTASGYFEQVQNHIDAVSVSLNNEAQTRGQNDAALGERIDGISTDLSTLNSYVESIYKPAEGEESASGVLQTEINRSVAADESLRSDLTKEIGDRGTAISNLSNTIGSYQFVPAEPAEGENPGQEAYYEATKDTYFGTVKQHIDEAIAERIAADAALSALVETNTNAISTINTTTITEIRGIVSGNSNNISEIKDVTIPDINDRISNIGTYEYKEKTSDNNAEANVIADTYFAEVKSHIEGEAAEVRAEFVAADGVLDTKINTLATEVVATNTNNIATLRDDYDNAITLTSTTTEEATTYNLTGGAVKDYIDALAGANVENNTVAGNATAINELATGAVKTNTDNIKNLKDNFDKAINLTKVTDSEVYTLTDGVVKDYIDAVEGKVGDLDAAYKEADKALTIKTIECGLYKLDNSNKLTDNNGTDKHSLKITFNDNNEVYYPLGDYIKDNYYTKTQANSAFLSADKDVFLTNGYLSKGKIENDEFVANDNGDWHIVLELKNVENPAQAGEKIVIPASTLVNDYAAAGSTDAITVTVSDDRKIGATLSTASTSSITLTNKDYKLSADLKINSTSGDVTFTVDANGLSANLSSDIKDKIDNDTYVSSIESTYTPYSTGDSGTKAESFKIKISQTGTHATPLEKDLLTDLNSYIATKSFINSTTLNSTLASYSTTTQMNTAIDNKANSLYEIKDGKTQGTIGSRIAGIEGELSTAKAAISTLNDTTIPAIGDYAYTTNASADVISSATTSGGYFGNVKAHIEDLAAYVDSKDNALSGRFSNYLPLVGGTLTDNLKLESSSNTLSNQPKLQWKSINSIQPQIGFPADQSDGTFILMSINGLNTYKDGLAIGGTSGNLFWKGNQVAVISESDNDAASANTIVGAKKYSDAKADDAAKTVYNTYTAAGTVDTQYPILGGAKAESGNTQAVSYSKATISAAGNVRGNKVYGSVWNDYAEYRQTHYKVRPGQCVYEKGDGSLAISYERMMPGANIVSDTFGFAIGETDECKTPLAVSGRVLAYPYESKEEYKAGDAVCSGPNGTISKMTRAEIRDYPERIVGTVSEIPTYEVWGSGNIKVNGRIWIKVR